MSNETFQVLSHPNIRSVAGASAGAMAAILLSAGIAPQHAAKFVSTLTLREFADFPGMMAVFKGHKFEDIMRSYLKSQLPPAHSLNLQDGVLPVAVTGFDLQTLRGTLIQRGNMARAARASSCVPFLFQPVGWIDVEDTTTSATAPKNYLFVDGGLDDLAGLKGLAAFPSPRRRVVNMVVGNFLPKDPPPPSQMPFEDVAQVLSISIQNLPQCGPWAMENGPLAVEGAKKAMQEALNLPLYLGNEPGHYELHIDASSFVPRT